MNLVYESTGEPVQVGDMVDLSDGEKVRVSYFRKPHNPSSSGKVTVEHVNQDDSSREYFVGVIGAKWINREDR